jgi:membrane protease YdiL (CAAX protease family)
VAAGKFMRFFEYLLLYVGLPLLLWVTKAQDMLLPVLWLGAIFAWTLLRYGKGNRVSPVAGVTLNLRKELIFIFLRFFLVALFLGVALYVYRPELLFWLPRRSLGLWGVIVIAYPILSVHPQTLVYRALYERRYAQVFSSPRLSLLMGTLVFCLAHIPFNNIWALAFTLPGGLIFLQTYRRTGSLGLSTLEHALYGDLLFTIGWGACLASAGTQRLFLNL